MMLMEENNEPTNVSWDLPAKQRGFMIAALLTGAFMGIMNETLLATAVPSIQDYFSISRGEVQWMTTAFLMANGVMIPISDFFIVRFTTRGLFFNSDWLVWCCNAHRSSCSSVPCSFAWPSNSSFWFRDNVTTINDGIISHHICRTTWNCYGDDRDCYCIRSRNRPNFIGMAARSF